jgi:site-specific recombinase XerD
MVFTLTARSQAKCPKCGRPIAFFRGRHTFASRLVMRGVNLSTVMELMGHSYIAMTMRHAHLAPAHKQDAVERLVAKSTDTRTDTEPILTVMRDHAVLR